MGPLIDGTKRELSVIGLRTLRFAALTVAAVGTFVGGSDAATGSPRS